MSKEKDILTKLNDRFSHDAAGFVKAFTKCFYEPDGTEQTLYSKQIQFLNLLKKTDNVVAVVKSRQIGISTAIQAKSLHKAYFGQTPELLIVSRSQKQSVRVLNKIKYFISTMPEFMRPELVKDTEEQIKFSNGSVVYSLPTNPDSCRGFTGDVFLDEYGTFGRKEGDEIWEAIYPCISKGYSIITASSPKGKNNMFYDLCNPKKDDHGDIIGARAKQIIRIHWSDVPHIAAVIDDLRLGMHPRQFLQEYECQFLDDISDSMFPYDFIMEKMIDDTLELIDLKFISEMNEDNVPDNGFKDEMKFRYPKGIYIGYDPAITIDGSMVTVFGIRSDEVWEMIAMKQFAKNTELQLQTAYVSLIAQVFGAKKVGFDTTGGLGLAVGQMLNKTKIRDRVFPVLFTNASKLQMYSNLRLMIEKEQISAPNVDQIISEFVNLSVNTVTNKIAAAGSGHDDIPSSFICAVAAKNNTTMLSRFYLI